MECGIIGLPGVGKTTLFRALTGSAPGPAAGSKPHVAVASIPDPRLDLISKFVPTGKVTPATLTFVDIPGIAAGAGAARAGRLLAHVRQVDAVCHVVRCWATPGAAEGAADPVRDIENLEVELILADLAVVEPAVDKATHPARAGDQEARARVAMLERVAGALNDGKPARTISDWGESERVLLTSYGLISAKPVLYVANVGEDDLEGRSVTAKRVCEHAATTAGESLAVCGALESELAELEASDRQEMLEGLGLVEPAIGPLARAVCRLLGLAVFYTTSAKEIRAWTVAAEATTPEAAGVVHSDMQRGFIRAECYSVDDLAELRSEKAIRAAGRIRTAGKSSRIREGDVMRVLFNV